MAIGVYRYSRLLSLASRGPSRRALREAKPPEMSPGGEGGPLRVSPFLKPVPLPTGRGKADARLPSYELSGEGELMVRTYWFFPVFNEASGNLDLQPFARIDHVEACRPRAMCPQL